MVIIVADIADFTELESSKAKSMATWQLFQVDE